MQFFSFLGSEDFFLIALPLVYWCLDAALGLRIGVMLLVTQRTNALFKMAMHGPRPYWVSTSIEGTGLRDGFWRPLWSFVDRSRGVGHGGGLVLSGPGPGSRRRRSSCSSGFRASTWEFIFCMMFCLAGLGRTDVVGFHQMLGSHRGKTEKDGHGQSDSAGLCSFRRHDPAGRLDRFPFEWLCHP